MHRAGGGFRGGALEVTLGGIDNTAVRDMSGGWVRDVTLSEPTHAILTFRYRLTQSPDYESDEVSQILVSVDGALCGTAPNDFVVQVVGNGNGGGTTSTGWRVFQVDLGVLEGGTHTIAIGGFNNKKTTSSGFIFWNNEESGLNGSTAYVQSRRPMQGMESPAGSGVFPEPRWLGMIQHDMILFDHGLPPQADQNPTADVDVEYQASSTFGGPARTLAFALRAAAGRHAIYYPAQVGSNMNYTDSWPFRNYAPAVSVRENQRVAEIGLWSNPNWHQPTDNYDTYSEADFLLGFNAVLMTTGAVAELSGTRLIAPALAD